MPRKEARELLITAIGKLYRQSEYDPYLKLKEMPPLNELPVPNGTFLEVGERYAEELLEELGFTADEQEEVQGPQGLFIHVDDFIDNCSPVKYEGERYAQWFFALYRFPAALKMRFRPYLKDLKLFCTWNGQRYRVTGCSRLGDVWLTANFERECGYEYRVNVDDCSAWSPTNAKAQ